MKVTLNPEAQAFVQQRGGHLILFQAEVSGCCGLGRALVPMHEVGYPRRPLAEYVSTEFDGVTVHVDTRLVAQPGEIRISLTRVMGWKKLSMEVAENPNGLSTNK